MTLVEVPFAKTDGPSKKILGIFLEAVKSSTGPVYVHCHGGTHRAAILAGLYRMSVQEWDFNRTAVEFGTLGGDLKGDLRKRMTNSTSTSTIPESLTMSWF